MTITVLLAPDGSLVACEPGHLNFDSMVSALSENDDLYSVVCFWSEELAVEKLRPGYRLEHHDLVELLARPTVEEHQASKAATVVAIRLGELTRPLRRERDALARCLAAVPGVFQKLAGEIYGHAYAAGHEEERDTCEPEKCNWVPTGDDRDHVCSRCRAVVPF